MQIVPKNLFRLLVARYCGWCLDHRPLKNEEWRLKMVKNFSLKNNWLKDNLFCDLYLDKTSGINYEKCDENLYDVSHRYSFLILIWVGFLGVRFEVVGVKLNPPPISCLKLIGIMLETWNLIRKYKRICSFRKYTF